MIISAFSGSGKTYLASQYDFIIDLEPLEYHWFYNEKFINLETEKKKYNLNRTLNPNWPENYIDSILEHEQNNPIVLISADDKIVDILEERNVICYNIFPSVEQKEDYLNRYLVRGNTKDYIDFWKNHFEYYINEKKRHKQNVEMIPGEFLEDTLKRIGFI